MGITFSTMPVSWGHAFSSLPKPAVGKDKIVSWGCKPYISSRFLRLGWGWGVIVSHLCAHLLSLSATRTLWEVPSCGPVWLPVRGTASLPPAPHGCAFISGTPPQTLPQAHLLIQVRCRAGWCNGGSRKRGVRAAFRTSQTARCGSPDFQRGSFGEWGTLRWDMLSGRPTLWSVNPQGC